MERGGSLAPTRSPVAHRNDDAGLTDGEIGDRHGMGSNRPKYPVDRIVAEAAIEQPGAKRLMENVQELESRVP